MYASETCSLTYLNRQSHHLTKCVPVPTLSRPHRPSCADPLPASPTLLRRPSPGLTDPPVPLSPVLTVPPASTLSRSHRPSCAALSPSQQIGRFPVRGRPVAGLGKARGLPDHLLGENGPFAWDLRHFVRGTRVRDSYGETREFPEKPQAIPKLSPYPLRH